MPQETQQFDVVIVGAGVIGCAIAWRLGQAGLRVAVVERGAVGREASSAAGGMLAPLAEADRADEFFELAVASRAMYADFARQVAEATGIDIEYRSEGTLFLALSEEDEEELESRYQWQRASGLNVKRLGAECVRKLEPQVNARLRWALKFPDDHQINARRLVTALEVAARGAGVAFRTHTEVRSLLTQAGGGQRRKQVVGLHTIRGNLFARCVVVAAGSWSSLLPLGDGNGSLPLEIEPVRGQMVALKAPTPPLSHVIYSRRGYLIPRLSGILIAGSTTERVGYDKRVTAGGAAAIVNRAVEIAPVLTDSALVETWAGLRPASPDGWPILGEDPATNGLIYATGHYRNGILLTPITAQLITQLILSGRSDINLSPFSISRFSVIAPSERAEKAN
jgi:glycine oxidase